MGTAGSDRIRLRWYSLRCFPERLVSKLPLLALAPLLAGCDYRPTTATLRFCQPTAEVSPFTPAIPFNGVMPVGASVTVSITQEGGCPAPLVRNDTPNVLQVDSTSAASVLISGLAAGSGRVRFVSGLDSLVWTVFSVTVTP